jgi:transcriptional regulator with XRE-family HTH domain
MTHEERVRVGLALASLRAKKLHPKTKEKLRQVDVAKAVKIAVGTLQAIENNLWPVMESNIEKVAHYYGTSLEALRAEDKKAGIRKDDERIRDINDEDIEVAQKFHHARMQVKNRVWALLTQPRSIPLPEEQAARASELVQRIVRLPDESIATLERVVADLEQMSTRHAGA